MNKTFLSPVSTIVGWEYVLLIIINSHRYIYFYIFGGYHKARLKGGIVQVRSANKHTTTIVAPAMINHVSTHWRGPLSNTQIEDVCAIVNCKYSLLLFQPMQIDSMLIIGKKKKKETARLVLCQVSFPITLQRLISGEYTGMNATLSLSIVEFTQNRGSIAQEPASSHNKVNLLLTCEYKI